MRTREDDILEDLKNDDRKMRISEDLIKEKMKLLQEELKHFKQDPYERNLSKREWIALELVKTLMMSPEYIYFDDVANDAVQYGDALIRALEHKGGDDACP